MPTHVSDPLLDLIKAQGLLDDLQLEEVKEEHARGGKPVSEILQDFGFLDMEAQLQIVASHLGTEVIELNQRDLTPEILSAIPADTARMYKCMPVAVFGSTVQLALADPLNPTIIDELGYVIKKDIVQVVADPPTLKGPSPVTMAIPSPTSLTSSRNLARTTKSPAKRPKPPLPEPPPTSKPSPMRPPSSASSTSSSFKPSRTAPVTSISSLSRTNLKSATAWTAPCTKCPPRPSPLRSRSFPG